MEPEKQFKLPPIRNKGYSTGVLVATSLPLTANSQGLVVYDRGMKGRKPSTQGPIHPKIHQACARPCATTPPPVPINIRPGNPG